MGNDTLWASEPVASFMDEVRSANEYPAPADLAAAHVAALAAAARTQRARTPIRLFGTSRRVHLVMGFAAAFLATGILVASLSFAGVFTFPKPVRSVFHFMRIDLPQGDDHAPGSVVPPNGPAPDSATRSNTGSNHKPVTGANHGHRNRGDSPDAPGMDSVDNGGGDSPDHPGGEGCQFPPTDIQKCLP